MYKRQVLAVVAFAVYRLIAALVRIESATDLAVAAAIGGPPGITRRIAGIQAAAQLAPAVAVAIPLGLVVARMVFDESVGPDFRTAWLVVIGLPILTLVVAAAVALTTVAPASLPLARRPT